MADLNHLFARNREWAAEMERHRPGFFSSLSTQQQPKYMWIGCSDSRVPANEIIGLAPGEIFVHRNIANVVVNSDLNALSTVQFAVEHLKVQHVMVVGHYGCSGVQAALEEVRIGLADNWLRHVKDVRDRHSAVLDAMPLAERANALCEFNVIEQVVNVAQSTVLQDAWSAGQSVTLHGLIYGVHDGLLQDLRMRVEGNASLITAYQHAVETVAAKRQGC